MSLRYIIANTLLAVSLLTNFASAQEAPRKTDYLSYYTYYKTKSGETVSDVALKFGLAEVSLVKMNPQLRQSDGSLPVGSLLCVPKEPEPEIARAEPSPKRVESTKSRAPQPIVKKQIKRTSKVKDVEEPSEAEWDKLAELATKNAPERPVYRAPEIEAPSSRMITSDGQVVYIPAAKPKAKPKPKQSERRPVELSSRKGKAILGIIETSRSFMGTPYVWGGELPGGFDCSGYVQYVFAQHGYKIPRTADIQFEVGQVVKSGDEKPGDLVFFETYAPGASHVGIFLGRGYFIHASSSRGVIVERLATDFFAQRYLGAKRNTF